MVTTRPMTVDDVDAAAATFLASISVVQEAYGLPGSPRPSAEEQAERHERLSGRIAHMLVTDPEGAWVAADGERVVGIAQAIRREGLWILSLLGVAGDHQDRGLGRALIERSLDYGDRRDPGLIYSSPDPRALRRYVRAGFALHPSVVAVGRVPRGSLPAVPGLRAGDARDLAFVERVDRHLRGASHGPDLEHLRALGMRLLVADDRGYALLRGSHLAFLGALDDDSARLLLRGALAEMAGGGLDPPGSADGGDSVDAREVEVDVEVAWLTAAQQWAYEVCTEVGLDLHPHGAVMVRGRPGPLAPYVPSGGFG